MIEDFFNALEQMSDVEFVRLLDEVRSFSNIGPSVDEYIEFINSHVVSPYKFVFLEEESLISNNNEYCLAA